jgi:diadenosine tetraphosphate (Ap4A) HIT family hydrolase
MIIPTCISCDIASGACRPEGGYIFYGKHFNAHQDVAYPVRGLVILASNRHFKCLDEMTDVEASEWLSVLREIRKAQREVLGVKEVYYFYNEDTKHHFHTWMVPRYEWMAQFGKSVEAVRPALLYAQNNFQSNESKAALHAAVESIRDHCSKNLPNLKSASP